MDKVFRAATLLLAVVAVMPLVDAVGDEFPAGFLADEPGVFSTDTPWLVVDSGDRAAVSTFDDPPIAVPPESADVDPASETEKFTSLDEELLELRTRLSELESSEVARTAAEKKKKETDADKKAAEEKTKLDDKNNKWTVKLAGHVQLDYINWTDADPAITGTPGTQDYFEFRRLRLVADGTGYGTCDFRLQMTLEPETVGENSPGAVTSPDVKDAYFSMNEIPGIGRFRIGNFFVPFSLEQVTNDTNNIFLERSIPTQGLFSADREVGIALYNQAEDYGLAWASGVFFDSISESLKERIDDNQGYRLSGRLTWLPIYDEASKGRYLLHTGAGILHTSDQDGRVRFRARPQIHEGPRLIDSGILLADSYTTGNVELAAVMGSLTLQSEAFLSSVDLNGGSPQSLHGAYAHASYFLTGENRIYEKFGQHGPQFGRNVPKEYFRVTPGCIKPGAWELKTRYSHLNLNQFHRGEYNDISAGFNWYWSDRTRIMFDWIHPVTTSAASFGGTSSDLIGMRFDFNW